MNEAPELTKLLEQQLIIQDIMFQHLVNGTKGEYLRGILRLPLLTEATFNLDGMNFSDDNSEFPVNRSIKIATFQNNFEPRCLTFHELFLLNSLQGLEEFNCQFFEIDHNLLKILDTLPNLKKITWHNCKIWEMTTLPTVQEIVFENSCRVLSITNRFLECNRHIKKLTMAITNHFRQDIVSANEWIYTILALTALEFLDLSKFGYNKILALAIINHKSLKTIVLPKNGNPNRMESNEVEDKESVKILKDKMTVIFK